MLILSAKPCARPCRKLKAEGLHCSHFDEDHERVADEGEHKNLLETGMTTILPVATRNIAHRIIVARATGLERAVGTPHLVDELLAVLRHPRTRR